MLPIQPLKMRGGGSSTSDPNFSSVVLLCGFDSMADGEQGAPLSTADEASPANGFSVVGSAQVDTAQAKFGSGSLLIPGSGRLETSGNTSDFNISTGDFTIEAFLRISSLGNDLVMSQWTGSGAGGNGTAKQWAFYGHQSGNIQFLYYTSAGTFRAIQGAWSPSTNTWYHVAVVRTGNNFMLFVDGVQKGSTATFADTISSSTTTAIRIGSLSDNGTPQTLNGWIDELRFTKGVARYTSNFTAPTAKFPRS